MKKSHQNLKSFQLRKPKTGNGLVFVLSTKGSRRYVDCIISGRNGIDKTVFEKSWLLQNTTFSFVLSDEEVQFLVEVNKLLENRR